MAGNVATYAYAYDHDWAAGTDTMLGQRTSMAATVPSQGFYGEATKYYYNPLYQMSRVDYPNVAPLNGEIHQWTYDALGNRLTNTVNSSTQTYTYQHIGANPLNWQRLLNDGNNAYTYDNNGSAFTRNGPGGNVTFAWDHENRMGQISGATAAIYQYDYQGRRAQKSVGPNSTYLYDGLNLVHEAGAAPADYLFGPAIDEPLAMSRGGQIYYYGADALGSVNAVTDSSGTVQKSYVYDAWGQARSQTGALANPFTYTSRELGEAGLDFYRARYYQPSIGRFLAEDPLPSLRQFPEASPHIVPSYAYVENNPVLLTDPLGLAAAGTIPSIPELTTGEPNPRRGETKAYGGYVATRGTRCYYVFITTAFGGRYGGAYIEKSRIAAACGWECPSCPSGEGFFKSPGSVARVNIHCP